MALWERLHIRLAAVIVVLLVVVFVSLMGLLRQQSTQAVLESTQRQNMNLASNIALMQPRDLIDINGRVDLVLMRTMAQNVMKINPSLEVYLLDANGRVAAHALDSNEQVDASVDLKPVRALAIPSIDAPRYPVLGSDPVRPGRTGVFSAAALGRGVVPDGYLYVMLNSANGLIHAESPAPDTLRTVGLAMLALLLVTGGTIAWAMRHLTRPLSQLTMNVQQFDRPLKSSLSSAATAEIRVLDNAIRAMQRKIANQVAALNHRDTMRRELISNVSHDLRTPLANIRGYVETLLLASDDIDDKERRQCLEVIHRQANRLGQRIDDLFELSKLDSGGVQPKPTEFCLAELVQDVVSSYELCCEARQIRLQFEPGDQPEASVCADIALIERVVQNLMDNAVQFTPDGGQIRVQIDVGTVGTAADQLKLRIANSGPGIAADHIPQLFERYWHGQDGNNQTDRRSSGLGLAIVKRILDLHDTAVRVMSSPGKLTVFEFDLLRC